MALKGTLRDFGIADILQLIGQQQKTGMLHLKSKEEQVQIGFKDGSIVKAESATRKKKDLLGNMLVRAELITEEQLERALETQQRTLKRLGDVLVSSQYLSAESFRRMMQLQATETLYHLFFWKSGTYEFEQGDVEFDSEAVQPLRAESVLMEGFRMVDEWPFIKKVISHFEMTFERLRELPPPRAVRDDVEDAFDDAFSEKKKDENRGEFKSVGDSERRVFALVQGGREVRKLIDLSCLGEFETCKALCNLVNLEYLKPCRPQGRLPGVEGAGWLKRAADTLGRLAVTVAILAVLTWVGSRSVEAFSLGSSPASSYADPAIQRFIAREQQARIEAALEVFRLERGELPERLEGLVEAGLLAPGDLNHPWRNTYYYRRLATQQFILLPPLR